MGPDLLERERELRRLDVLVAEACGGRGQMVLVEGPPGIGKTRLLEAARERARERGMVVLTARASELDRDFPFGVVRQLFEREASSLELLRGAAAGAAPLLGLPAPGADSAPLPGSAAAPPASAAAPPAAAPLPGSAAALPAHALYWLTANLAERSPAALVIDDVHWADAGSLRFLQFLLPRLEELPVLVALAARTREPGTDRLPLDVIATDPLTAVVRPAPLTHGAVRALAAALGESVDPAFADACRQATGGNPFLLRELLRELAAEGVAPTRDGAPLVRELAPPTVARAVVLRLARLGDDASSLARAVAVLGDGVPLRRAAALAGLAARHGDAARADAAARTPSPPALARAAPPARDAPRTLSPPALDRAGALAAALADADILAPARPLAFAHPILRAAVYGDIEPGELAAAHRRAADLLAADGAGPEELAVHLLATEPAGDPYVVATLREAAARAVARGSAPIAVACLRRALAEPPRPDERGAVAFALASAEIEAGEPTPAAEHFEEGVRVTSDPRTRATHALDHANALLAAGRGDEAVPLLERAVLDVRDEDPELALVVESYALGMGRAIRARLPSVRERLAHYRGRLTGATAGERLLLAVQAHIDAFSRSSREPAAALADVAERALADGRLLDDARGVAPSLFFALDVLLLADRIEPARRVLDQAVDDARRRGSLPGFAFASGMRCGLLARVGDLPAAEADGRSFADLAFEQGWFLAQPNGLGSLIGVLVDRGELDHAEWVDRQTREADVPGADLGLARIVHARARLLVARGEVAAARVEAERLGRPRARWNTYPTLAPWVLVAPALAPEDPDEARAEADRMLQDARSWGTPRAIGMALHASGLVIDGARRLELLEEAGNVLADAPAPFEQARALTDFGAALRRANRRTAAREPLRRALDLADSCGARPLAERARQELRAAGGRPRRPRTSGVDALTASERRTAAMAAEGMSNPEIAQALFVTTKTVEAHLSNAYRKLDIASRAELPAALRS
ncbi:MAG TPA: AAA family ATPase [Solirubrobacteraceae bacterium]|jgi:DNA-binding CsgD family transcriptional regulator